MFGLNKKKMIDLFKWLIIVTGITALVVGIAFGVIFSIRIRNYRSECDCGFNDDAMILCENEDIGELSTSGDGTLENPYLIENSTFGAVCIGGSDRRITVHFVVQNCTFNDSFIIDRVNNYAFQNCRFTGEMNLNLIVECNSFVFQNCSFLNRRLKIIESTEFSIVNCNFDDEIEYIRIDTSRLFKILDCCFKNDYVEMEGCDYLRLENNRFESTTFDETDNGLRIYGYSVRDLVLKNNTFLVGGIHYFEFSKHLSSNQIEFSNNTLDGLPILFLKDESSKTFTENYGQIFLLNCSDILISNQSFSKANSGITIYYSSNCTIIKNNFTGCYNALFFHASKNCYFYNNTILNSFETGMHLFYTNYTRIKFNHFQNSSSYGLVIHGYSNNWINYNNFINNNILEFRLQVVDGYYNENNWNYNHWSDWGGYGRYKIPGPEAAYDYFPLTDPVDI